jgi:aspartate aminotransferase
MAITQHVSLNMRVRGLPQSATIAINERSLRMHQAGQDVFRLGLGQSPFPVPEPVVEELRRHAQEKNYQAAQGAPRLREAVAHFHARKDGLETDADHVLIGPGSKELMFLLQLVYYGELLVPSPCWVSYAPQARIIGRQVALLHTGYEDRWRVTPDVLEAHCHKQGDPFRPRILILNYPGNPEGCTYTADELRELAEVSCRYGIIVLSDEIYGQLHHKGEHRSIAQYCPERTIISSGLSKWCGAGGWRLGTFAFPPSLSWLLEAMTAVASETFTSVSAPIQCASVRAFDGGSEIEAYLGKARRILSALGNHLAATLRHGGLRVHSPEGAFYLFLDFSPHADSLRARRIRTSTQLCEQLLQDTGVALLPGVVFERPEAELTARLAYVDFDGAGAMAACPSSGGPLPDDYLRQNCGSVLEATRRIVDWLN